MLPPREDTATSFVSRCPRHPAIGYVKLFYALQKNVPMAGIKSAGGEFIKPTPEGVTGAMDTAMPRIIPAFQWSTFLARGTTRSAAQLASSLSATEGRSHGQGVSGLAAVDCPNGEEEVKSLDHAPLGDPDESSIFTPRFE